MHNLPVETLRKRVVKREDRICKKCTELHATTVCTRKLSKTLMAEPEPFEAIKGRRATPSYRAILVNTRKSKYIILAQQCKST